MASPPRRRVLPPALPDELVEEILLRLPPDDPPCLLRASLVCKTWSGIVSHAVFRRRLHELHRAPPVLGFLHDWDDERIPRFIPTTASSFSLAAPEWRSWRAIDCRHGRALFLSKGQDISAWELLLWEPITGAQQRVPVPAAAFESDMPTAAVFCAADGCNHHNCLGGPFCVVFLFGVVFFTDDSDKEQYVTSACVYSSETGAWGELASLPGQFGNFEYFSSVLVRRSLLYFMSDAKLIQEYDLAGHSLAVFSPPNLGDFGDGKSINLMVAEDGGLGVSEALDQHLKLWSREVGDGTDDRWVLSRVINLKILLPNDALVDATSSVQVLGYAEEANVIFVNTVAGLFSIELQSERARRVCDDHDVCNLIPVVSFYTPHSPLERAQELFNKGRKAVEERDFTNAINCFRHALKIRVQHYGELAPECANTFYRYGRALLCKALQAANPSKRAPNEESVKITPTTNKDDAGSSEASGSSVEHVPPARKGDSEEGANLNGKNLEDANTTGDGDDSDLDLAWKMLDTARAIVAKSPDKTVEKVNIFCALAQVSTKTGDRDNTIGYYLKALAMLEHLVRPDHPQIIKINVHICVAFELASKVGDAIPYCAKAISVCKSRIQNLKHAMEALLADKEVCTSAAEGRSGKFTPEEEICFLTRFLARLQKKLEKLELAMSAPSPCTDKTMKRAVSMASHEQNVSSTVARAASSTSQMAGSNNSLRSPTMSIAATDFRIVSTGMEHANDKQISNEPSPKRFAADDSPFVNEM